MSTLAQISQRIKNDVGSRLPETRKLLRNSLSNILIESFSGAFLTLYRQLDIVARDSLVITAKADKLNQFGSIWGVSRLPATKASGLMDLIGEGNGSITSADAFIDDANVAYVYDGAELSFSDAQVFNLTVVAKFSGSTEIPLEINHSSLFSALVPRTYLQGKDEESDESYRKRILARIHQVGAGGKASDYAKWLQAIPNVGKYLIQENEDGLGTIHVIFLDDNDLVPNQALIDLVDSTLQASRPMCVRLTVGTPVIKPIDVSLRLSPDSAVVRADTISSLTSAFQERSFYDRNFSLSWVGEAISSTIGEDSHVLLSPTEDIKLGKNDIITLGVVTFA